MPKNCPQCGTENSDTAKFCKQCAVPLRSDSAARCPKGHIIAPGQSKCPICEAEKQKGKTVVEEVFGGPKPPISPVTPNYVPSPILGGNIQSQIPHAGPVRPAPGPTPGGGGRGATMVLNSVGPGGRPAEPVSDRKIVGALITYSTRPDGQVFPLREGRNRIGRNPENEVVIPDDAAMSGLNTFIVFHPQGKKQFLIDDANSQNGTFMNGQIVEERTRLHNYSEIRAGSTVFTFIAVRPEMDAQAEAHSGKPDFLKEMTHGSSVSNL